MVITTFKEKINKVQMRSKKLSVFDTSASSWGDMIICEHCDDTWNNHAGYSNQKVPAGMCLTEANLNATGTYVIAS